ncbi:hydroxyacid dehydrogenase [Cellulomonas fimi]|nr:hydroxyacid dehydrogenase [Cellulomonas fimi]
MDPGTFALQFPAPARERLQHLARTGRPLCVSELDSAPARRRIAEAEVLLTSWGAPTLTPERVAAAPRLRAVLHCAGSVRGLVSDAVWERDLLVTSAADANARPVAEFTLAAIIFAGKRAPFLAATARTRRDDWSFGELGDLSNRGRTVGIVGFSRIGRRVVELLRVLETAAVLVADPVADPADIAAAGAEHVSLDELLRRSDVVSLHAPALPATHHLLGAAQLALLRDGATLVNTARGSLVDTAALETECAAGRLDAVLDVTDPEPLPPTSVLHDLPNVMLTPHVAGSLGSETQRMSDQALDELERYVHGLPPIAPVTRARLEVLA